MAEIAGYGARANMYHFTAPHPERKGAIRAMRRALEKSGVELTDVGYIDAHGTSTQLGGVAETMAIKSVFGEHAQQLAVSSTKSVHDHLLGAAGDNPAPRLPGGKLSLMFSQLVALKWA